MQFRTFNADGILLYHAFHAPKRGNDNNAFVALFLQNAELMCEISLGMGRRHVFAHKAGSSLNDGRWHLIHLAIQRNAWLNMTVDGETELANVKFELLTTGTEVHIGGTDAVDKLSSRHQKSFIGCIRWEKKASST